MVKGLVIDRIQKLRSGRAVLNTRICRASYAISLDLPYDPKKHKGQEVYKHYDGVLYARNQMDWMIRKVNYLRHFEAFKRADQIKGGSNRSCKASGEEGSRGIRGRFHPNSWPSHLYVL